MLMTLMLSQGIPILIGGDENARSQRGNSNAYCEDNEISWFEWDHPDVELRLFTTRLVELRRRHPVFRRRRYVQGRPVHGDGLGDIVWFRPDGAEMTDDDWQSGFAKSMAVFLNGSSIASPGRRGEPVVDDSFLLVFNAHHEDLKFTVSGEPVGRAWIGVLDTADPLAGGELSAVAPTCSHRSARSSSSGESELGALARTCTGRRLRVGRGAWSEVGGQMNTEQVHELLYQALETELGGVQVYAAALRCVSNDDLRKEWGKYHEQTTEHLQIVTDILNTLGLDPNAQTPGRAVVGHIGKSLVAAMELALDDASADAAELVACECVALAETKDHLNWELIGEVGKRAKGDLGKTLRDAYKKVEDQEDEHLYHTAGWGRELWISSLGMPAVLPRQRSAKR